MTAIVVVCPNPKCRQRMRTDSRHAGRKSKCPYCQQTMEIVDPSRSRAGAGGDFPSWVLLPTNAPGGAAERPRAAGTEVNTWLAGLFGAGATVALYAVVFLPLHSTYLGKLMLDRGPIQYAITLVTCWGIAILVMKYLAVKREIANTERELELIPLEIGLQITPGNVEQFLEHLDRLPPGQQRSLLAKRIRGALDHFKQRNSVPEVQTYLASEAELEASAVDSGYTLLRTFIWVCPILGFIGTVMGISDAVTGLAQSLTGADAGAEVVKTELGQKMLGGMKTVTDGLAVAFDTTFLGLVCVVLLMFPTEALRKTEYGMLDRVEAFANESLLRRMAESDSSADPEMPAIVKEALDAAFKEHQRWLAQWQAQVAKLGEEIGGALESALSAVQQRWAQSEAERLENIKRACKAVEDLFGSVIQSTQGTERASRDARTALADADRLQRALANQLAQLQEVAGRALPGDIEPALRSLRDVLERLEDKLTSSRSVSRGPPPPPRKGGLFGWWGGDDDRR